MTTALKHGFAALSAYLLPFPLVRGKRTRYVSVKVKRGITRRPA